MLTKLQRFIAFVMKKIDANSAPPQCPAAALVPFVAVYNSTHRCHIYFVEADATGVKGPQTFP